MQAKCTVFFPEWKGVRANQKAAGLRAPAAFFIPSVLHAAESTRNSDAYIPCCIGDIHHVVVESVWRKS